MAAGPGSLIMIADSHCTQPALALPGAEWLSVPDGNASATEIAVLNIAKDDEVEMQTECLIIWPCIQDYGQMVAKIRRLLAVKPSPRPELSAKVDNGEAP